jgi:hypothetical protein
MIDGRVMNLIKAIIQRWQHVIARGGIKWWGFVTICRSEKSVNIAVVTVMKLNLAPGRDIFILSYGGTE